MTDRPIVAARPPCALFVVIIHGYDRSGAFVLLHAAFGDAEAAMKYCQDTATEHTSYGRVFRHSVPGPPDGAIIWEFNGYDAWLESMQPAANNANGAARDATRRESDF
jgi:hypothetical protein